MPPSTLVSMQGVQIPEESVNQEEFMAATRRTTFQQRSFTYAGLGGTDNVEILHSGILSQLKVRVSGSVVVTLGGGTCATTAAWPYGIVKNAKFSANGQSNLINCGGIALKAREIMARGDLNDRGVSRGSGGASPGTTVTQGTLSKASEVWGLNNNVSAVPGAPTTYNFDLEFEIPIAADELTLAGAVFAQTASTDFNLTIDWASLTDLFTLTGAATAVVTANVVVSGKVYTIPQDGKGGIIVPDLSMFHSIIENRFTPANGVNEPRFVGQGVGRYMLRYFFRVLSSGAPLALNATNYAQLGWRFGGNDTPEFVSDGQQQRYLQEGTFGSDLANVFGWVVQDFSSENAFRDVVDEGLTNDLRAVIEIPSGVTLTSPEGRMVQETLFAGAVGA